MSHPGRPLGIVMAREPSLQDVQRWMKSRIRPGDIPWAGAAPVLNPQRGTPGTERLAVYAGGYVTRIREALAEVYEAVHHVLGERAFWELAGAYAARHPSSDYNLSFAGRRLPECLETWPRTARLPFLPDLARLEWRVCEAFHAFDQPPADLASFAGLPLDHWGRVRVAFQPSVKLVASRWPIRDIWEARLHPRNEVDIDLINRPQRVLIRRAGVRVTCELLDERPALLLERLLAGDALGAACGALAQFEGTERIPAAEWCSRWARQGLIARLERC